MIRSSRVKITEPSEIRHHHKAIMLSRDSVQTQQTYITNSGFPSRTNIGCNKYSIEDFTNITPSHTLKYNMSQSSRVITSFYKTLNKHSSSKISTNKISSPSIVTMASVSSSPAMTHQVLRIHPYRHYTQPGLYLHTVQTPHHIIQFRLQVHSVQ